MASTTKKTKALDLAITQIDRQFGKGSIMKLGNDKPSTTESVISTGCLSLDVALGVGGVPPVSYTHLTLPTIYSV